MSSSPAQWAGLILAGGRSSRLGRDKATLPWHGQTLLEYLVQVMGQVVQPIVVAAAAGQELPVLPTEISVVRDSRPTEGPLRGLREGLFHIRGTTAGLLVVPVDAAAVVPDLLKLLLDHATRGEVVVGEIDHRPQPLPGCYAVSLLPRIEARLLSGERSLLGLIEESHTFRVPEADLRRADPELRSYWPLNTPEDLTRIQERWM